MGAAGSFALSVSSIYLPRTSTNSPAHHISTLHNQLISHCGDKTNEARQGRQSTSVSPRQCISTQLLRARGAGGTYGDEGAADVRALRNILLEDELLEDGGVDDLQR